MLFFYFQLLLTSLCILFRCQYDMDQHTYFITVFIFNQGYISVMNPLKIIVSILQLLRKSTNLQSNRPAKLHKLSILSTLCGTKELKLLQSHGSQTSSSLNNVSLIKQTIIAFLSYFIGTVTLSLLTMSCLLAQPFINDFLKGLIKQKINNNTSFLVFEIVFIYLSFKLINSLFEIASDFCSMIFGVKFYSSITLRLIRSISTSKMDSHFIARVQDDCQRLVTMPSSFTNSVIKISQFIVLSSLLLSKIPQHKIEIAIQYWIFLITSVLLAHYSWKMNLKVMHSKQNRIEFESSKQNILRHRSEELKQIRNIIIIDGIGIIMPWILNTSLTILVYGIVDMPNDTKYFVLITFGLIRTSISGLGRNLNLFAQSWSSLSRITIFLSENQAKIKSSQILITNQIGQRARKVLPADIIKESKDFKLSRLMEICSQCVPCSNIIIIMLGLLLFASNFLYGYCAKSLLSGDSVFKTFNIVSLSLSLLSPLLLYSFISHCNLKMSKRVYNILLQEKAQKIGINAEFMNRLSGDIRLLDRNLYFVVYGSISHIANISASFVYTSVILDNAFSFGVVLAVLLGSIMLVWLCTRLMKLRKQSYRKQSANKGKMLQKIMQLENCIGKWKNIYTYKFYGYSIEVAFIALLYFVMILISTLIIIVLLVSQVSVQESSVLILMISQLDSQLLYFFIQVMMLQTITAAVNRCWSLINSSKQNQ